MFERSENVPNDLLKLVATAHSKPSDNDGRPESNDQVLRSKLSSGLPSDIESDNAAIVRTS